MNCKDFKSLVNPFLEGLAFSQSNRTVHKKVKNIDHYLDKVKDYYKVVNDKLKNNNENS